MPDVARTYCAHSRPIPTRDQCQFQVGWARLARAVRIPPTMSWDFSRSNARGRSDLHSPNDVWTSQAHGSPGMLQDRRGMNAASSPFNQNGVARLAATDRSGFRRQIDGLGWLRASLCINIRDLRDGARGLGDRQAPIFRQESEGGIRRRVRRQPGGESGRDWCMDVGPPVRAAATQGTRLGGSHHGLGNGGCCKVGEPAGESFDAAARDDRHEYEGRSLRETDRGGCRAAPGGRGICCVPK